ncbi:MarR family transcriptional regulator [Erythrobacter litoralis]|uniref:MarR family winged helix-turn-helix transcriptional regulator n=1 Tax=Erythrobacter litoralis TaxID=39960 RepID=UPI002434EF88|nr:MarR family transcriptional regulator [Erythrobacter litoralis]MDG6080274.1 MarR family transcriptional regulator [Erythrobacter litoralis]
MPKNVTQARFERYSLIAQQFGARTVVFQQAAARLLDLNVTQLECLQLIRHLGPLTASDLAREIGITQASISAVVAKLIERKLIAKQPSPKDKRIRLLRLTDGSADFVDAIYDKHVARMKAIIGGISDAELDIALGFMQVVEQEMKLTAIELNRSASARASCQAE